MIITMENSGKLYFILIYIATLTWIEGSHFKGGTITYKVLKTYGSIVSISITQTYVYTHTTIRCNDTMIASQSPLLFPNNSSNILVCNRYCGQSGGYKPISIDPFCTDYSTALDITVGQGSDVINITNGSYFLVAFKGSSWRRLDLQKGPSMSSSWSVACLINLRIRYNGEYNYPPVSAMISPIYIPVGIPQEIFIPTIDADNDEVRCRFAKSSYECGTVCYPASLPKGTDLLPNCTLLITGANAGDWYAVAIMIEDFVDSMSNTPLSSIPVQFLINVQSKTTCSSPCLTGPVTESGECVGVLVGQSHSMQLTVEHVCSNSTTIRDIATLSFPNVIKTLIVQNTTFIWSISLTWIPTVEQIGSQILCAIAIDSNNIQSNQYCITFTVAEGSTTSYPEETIMPTTQFATIDSTSITMTDLVVVSTPSGCRSPWPWAAPLIAILAGGLIVFSIWCICCYLSCFTCCRKRSPIHNISQQDKIIRPSNRPYRIYKIFEKNQTSNVNNLHQTDSLKNTDSHTSRNTPTSTSQPVNNGKSLTPTSVTQSYLFGSRHALKINQQ